jgi:hypothetical protein
MWKRMFVLLSLAVSIPTVTPTHVAGQLLSKNSYRATNTGREDHWGISTGFTFGPTTGASATTITWTTEFLFTGGLVTISPFFGIGAMMGTGKPYDERYDDEGKSSFARIDYGLTVLLRIGSRKMPYIPISLRNTSYAPSGSYPFVGLRLMAHRGIGLTEEALDCMDCSNEFEEFHGGENAYLVAGYTRSNKTITVDIRLTDRSGYRKLSADDPWGVGHSYDNTEGPYVEPRVVLALKWYWLWER